MSGLFPYRRGFGVVASFDAIAAEAADKIEDGLSELDERENVANIQTMRGIALTVTLRLADAVGEDSLDDGELPSERMDALMIQGLDTDKDGDVDDVLYKHLSAYMADAMSSLGVPDDVIDDTMSIDVDTADAAIEAASEKINANLPSDTELDDWSKAFIYGFDLDDDGDEDGFDAAGSPKRKKPTVGKSTVRKGSHGQTLRYKGVKAIRHGQVVVINKRVSGKVVMNAKQKAALKKAGMKAHTAGVIKRQLRSLTKGDRLGLYKAGGLVKASTARYRKSLSGGH